MGRLEDKVMVVTPTEGEQAAALARAGAAVVVAGPDAGAVGALLTELRAAGARAAGFVGEATDPAVAEMAAEIFPDRVLSYSSAPEK